MITKCLFPVGGYGTRFLPVTKAVPKEMLPILTKPLLQYGIEEALSAGISNMAIVTGRNKRAIEDHFDKSYELESLVIGTSQEKSLKEITDIIHRSTFSYIRQRDMLGLGHAILSGEPLIGNQTFAVHLADDLCINKNNNLLHELIEVHKKYNCSVVAIEEVPINESSKYGIISGDLMPGSTDCYKVNNMVEKPNPKDSPSNMAIVGRYILTPDIFEILKNTPPGINNEIQITDALLNQAKKGKVIAYKFKGKRFDCGNIQGYLDATIYHAKLQGLNINI
jgi:UTP--glucose-1-phosphate uridylyltransferase